MTTLILTLTGWARGVWRKPTVYEHIPEDENLAEGVAYVLQLSASESLPTLIILQASFPSDQARRA